MLCLYQYFRRSKLAQMFDTPYSNKIFYYEELVHVVNLFCGSGNDFVHRELRTELRSEVLDEHLVKAMKAIKEAMKAIASVSSPCGSNKKAPKEKQL